MLLLQENKWCDADCAGSTRGSNLIETSNLSPSTGLCFWPVNHPRRPEGLMSAHCTLQTPSGLFSPPNSWSSVSPWTLLCTVRPWTIIMAGCHASFCIESKLGLCCDIHLLKLPTFSTFRTKVASTLDFMSAAAAKGHGYFVSIQQSCIMHGERGT